MILATKRQLGSFHPAFNDASAAAPLHLENGRGRVRGGSIGGSQLIGSGHAGSMYTRYHIKENI